MAKKKVDMVKLKA